MKKTAFAVDQMLSSFPDDREEILLYAERVRKYSSECGCSLGAIFLMVAAGISVCYVFVFNELEIALVLKELVAAAGFMFLSSIAGKLIGIGIARIKLAHIQRHIAAKYQIRRGY